MCVWRRVVTPEADGGAHGPRTDRVLQVRVSFETMRFGQQHLIEIYGRLATGAASQRAPDAGGRAGNDDATDGDGIRAGDDCRTNCNLRSISEAQVHENTIARRVALLCERVGADCRAARMSRSASCHCARHRVLRHAADLGAVYLGY
jgi:hypothetical protein